MTFGASGTFEAKPGNGETASDYESIGSVYNQIGVNLFVADYRGYGRSGGRPTLTSMIKDAYPIFEDFKRLLKERGFSGNLFIMGRSLGSASAVELANRYEGCDTISTSGMGIKPCNVTHSPSIQTLILSFSRASLFSSKVRLSKFTATMSQTLLKLPIDNNLQKVILLEKVVLKVRRIVEITIRGGKYEITKEKIEIALKDADPQRISKYAVLINGRLFPIKQVIVEALGVSPMELSTMVAYQTLEHLGFKVTRKND